MGRWAVNGYLLLLALQVVLDLVAASTLHEGESAVADYLWYHWDEPNGNLS